MSDVYDEPAGVHHSQCYYCGPGVPGGYMSDRGDELCFACLCREEDQTAYERDELEE